MEVESSKKVPERGSLGLENKKGGRLSPKTKKSESGTGETGFPSLSGQVT